MEKVLTKNNLIIALLLLFLGLYYFDYEPQLIRTVETKTVIKTDTNLVKIIGELQSEFSKFKNQKPEIVYVRNTSERIIERVPQSEYDTLSKKEKEAVIPLNEYKDTLKNKDITIFSKILTDGHIFDNNLKYEFNQPVITNNISKTEVVKQKGIYLFGEVGGGQENYNIGVGAAYINKKDWMYFYKLELDGVGKPLHNIGIGKKVF